MIRWWHYCIAVGVTILAIWMLAGCASAPETELHRMNREVQDCILSGGHARLGPGHTILCE